MSDTHGHAVLRTAQSLMATRGYGWSKAISAAQDLWGEAEDRTEESAEEPPDAGETTTESAADDTLGAW